MKIAPPAILADVDEKLQLVIFKFNLDYEASINNAPP